MVVVDDVVVEIVLVEVDPIRSVEVVVDFGCVVAVAVTVSSRLNAAPRALMNNAMASNAPRTPTTSQTAFLFASFGIG